MAIDLTGQVLGDYVLIERLTDSGKADVYKAVPQDRLRSQNPVAIKVVHNEERDADAVKRFMREMRLLDELQHPHIIPMITWGISQHQYPYVITEFIEGLHSLEAVMRQQALTLKEVWEIFEPVCTTLMHVHDLDILHRDIKPNKIYVRRGHGQFQVYLGNFALSKQVGVDSTMTATGVTMGTPSYLAPELGRGEPPHILSDLYSLGITLYELALGVLPFNPDQPAMLVILAHVTQSAPRPSELNPDFPAAIEDVILRGISKAPAERYQSAVDFLDAFKVAYDTLTPQQQNTSYWT